MKNKIEKRTIFLALLVTVVSALAAQFIGYLSLVYFVGIYPPRESINVMMTTAGIVPMLVAFPIALYVLIQKQDVDELNKKLENLLTFDELTGLFTRGTFFKKAQVALTNALCVDHKKFPEEHKTNAVFFGDLDHFKKINDRFGHSVGDEVLRLFGRIIRKHMDNSKFPNRYAGRFGGEEIVAVAIECSHFEAKEIANAIVKEFAENAAVVNGFPVAATASIGVHISSGTDNIDQIVSEADKRLYRAKNEGRNTVRIAA